MKTNYLKITMHDNDFTGCWENLGNCIRDALIANNYYPNYSESDRKLFDGKELDEEDLNKLKPWIENLWFSIFNLEQFLRWNNSSIKFKETDRKIFDCELSIVDYLEIPDWDNGESIFIPLFSKNVEILLR